MHDLFQLAATQLFSQVNQTFVLALGLRNELLIIKFMADLLCLGSLEGKICLGFQTISETFPEMVVLFIVVYWQW